MEGVKEMAKRKKETFDPDECQEKAGDTNEFEKYLYVATEKSMESGKAENPHYKGRREEIVKIL